MCAQERKAIYKEGRKHTTDTEIAHTREEEHALDGGKHVRKAKNARKGMRQCNREVQKECSRGEIAQQTEKAQASKEEHARERACTREKESPHMQERGKEHDRRRKRESEGEEGSTRRRKRIKGK